MYPVIGIAGNYMAMKEECCADCCNNNDACSEDEEQNNCGNDGNCCMEGICNPFMSCNICMFYITEKEDCFTYQVSETCKPLFTGDSKTLPGFIADHFQPPEFV